VILGSDSDLARWRLQQNSLRAESGSDTNITALRSRRYHFNSTQRFLDVRYSRFLYVDAGIFQISDAANNVTLTPITKIKHRKSFTLNFMKIESKKEFLPLGPGPF